MWYPILLVTAWTATGGLWPSGPAAGDRPEISPTATSGHTDTAALGSRFGDPAARIAEIVRIGTWARPGDLRRLFMLLDSDDSSLRLAAARVLVRAGHAETLARIAAQTSDSKLPRRLEALTILREAHALPAEGRQAAERALADNELTMRLVAVDLLATFPSVDSVVALTGALVDGNREMRLAVIKLLGRTPDPRALLPLLERVDAPDVSERVAITQALGGFARVHPRLDAGPAVLRHLDDPNDDVRIAAIDALARLRWSAAVPALRMTALRRLTDGGPPARRAILALGEIGDAAAIDVLVELLRRPAPLDEVAVALRRVGRSAVKALVAMMADAYSTSAIAAISILGDIGDRAATPALARALQTRPTVAISAARALGNLRDAAAVTALIQSVTAPQYAKAAGVREACLTALAATGDSRAASVVERSLRDADRSVRIAAVTALARLPATPVTRPLLLGILGALPQLPAFARVGICPALARAGLPETDAQLVTLLQNDPDGEVRAAAAWAARWRRDVQVVAHALERARAGDVDVVAQNAAAAIAETASPAWASAVTREASRASDVLPSSSVGLRLVLGDGTAVAGEWIRFHAGARVIWIRTDERGEAVMIDPPPGPYRASLATDDDDQDRLTTATASGKSPASTPDDP